MDKVNLIQRCNELAMLGAGFVSPNPLVGAVLADSNGNIVAEGYHKKHGDIHAEIDCINNAKQSAITDFTKLTLVVNLEPCTHFGKQPPCIDAIIDAKIPKVIVGMQDPNPIVVGKGIELLRNAGIEVEVGFLEKDCK